MLVGSLLTFLVLAVLQIGFALHYRNVLTATAAEGARYAANADRGPADGEAQARRLVGEPFSPAVAARLHYTVVERADNGVPVVEVTIRGPLPLVFLPAGPVTITARGHALDESRRTTAAAPSSSSPISECCS